MNRITPKKYANALNEINEYIRATSNQDYKHSDVRSICLRVKVTHLLFDHAIKLGYFENNDMNVSSNMQYFQPVHGRKVALSIAKYQRDLKINRNRDKVDQLEITIPTTTTTSHTIPPATPKRTPEVVKNQKTTFYELRLFGIPIYSTKSTK